MYDKFILDPADEIENIVVNGVVEGIKIKVRIPYYRGVALCLVENAEVVINGQVFTKDQMKFCVRGDVFYFDDMETITTVRWEFGEKAELFVPLINGLPEYGPSNIRVGLKIRASYNPGLTWTYCHMTYDRSASGGVCR